MGLGGGHEGLRGRELLRRIRNGGEELLGILGIGGRIEGRLLGILGVRGWVEGRLLVGEREERACHLWRHLRLRGRELLGRL